MSFIDIGLNTWKRNISRKYAPNNRYEYLAPSGSLF